MVDFLLGSVDSELFVDYGFDELGEGGRENGLKDHIRWNNYTVVLEKIKKIIHIRLFT